MITRGAVCWSIVIIILIIIIIIIIVQNERVKFVTEGSRDLGIDGLLDLVQSNQTSGGLQNPISSAIAMKKWTCSRMTIFDINIYPLSLLPDSCRAYQAVKCLVTASSKCPSVRKSS